MDPLSCMIVALWFEGREFYKTPDDIAAIAAVIGNRVEDARYPETVCDVVFEGCQFSFNCDGQSDTPRVRNGIDRRAYEVVEDVALAELEGDGLAITSTHYHTTGVLPDWHNAFSFDGQMGSHLFYTNETPYR